MKYDEKLVDELLEDVNRFDFSGSQIEGYNRLQSLKAKANALRPKPPKFYVLPEELPNSVWCILNHLYGQTGTWNSDKVWSQIREATATDKPMVHIPAGSDWDDEDLQALRKLWNRMAPSTDQVAMYIIDAIKAKLEGRI